MKRAILSAVVSLLICVPAFAGDYPDRAVTMVVPVSAGGSVDQGARVLAEGLSSLWGQPVVVNNRPGAGSEIGTAYAARARPDGYTILYHSASFTNLPAVKKNLPFNVFTDFIPVASTGIGQVGIAVGPSVAARNFEEFVAEAKRRTAFYAANGVGSAGHLLSEAVNLAAGINMKAVQFGSGSESVTDVAAGRTDAYISSMPAMMPMLEAKRLRLLGMLGTGRAVPFPDVATLSEMGYAEVDNASAWWGIYLPAGTPPEIVAKINTSVDEVVKGKKFQDFLRQAVAIYRYMSPEEFASFTRSEFKYWQRVVDARGIAVE